MLLTLEYATDNNSQAIKIGKDVLWVNTGSHRRIESFCTTLLGSYCTSSRRPYTFSSHLAAVYSIATVQSQLLFLLLFLCSKSLKTKKMKRSQRLGESRTNPRKSKSVNRKSPRAQVLRHDGCHKPRRSVLSVSPWLSQCRVSSRNQRDPRRTRINWKRSEC